MPTPLPTQLSGALFLAQRKAALLADEPRVGKTGAALIAADYIFARTILIVTTASGRAVWRRAVKEWCAWTRADEDVLIVGWSELTTKAGAAAFAHRWDLLILDESHYAKNFDAKRTAAVYGEADNYWLHDAASLRARAEIVWCLTGTPMPNSPADLFPMLRALAPERLGDGLQDQEAFVERYCVTKPKKVGQWRWIKVVVGSRNLEELRERLDGFMLRRTQADVGIRSPIYELMPIAGARAVAERLRPLTCEADEILAAAEAGNTRDLEMHLGPLRRITGEIKAPAVCQAVEEAFECGLDKIVLMAWHTGTVRALEAGLTKYGSVMLDGSTSARDRTRAVEAFRDDPRCRVFVGQIKAAGEAIDLSAAAELWFVETSFVPADMAQAALRITNHSQTRQAVVRVCVLEGSIDEALQAILLRKWSGIREVINNADGHVPVPSEN